MVKGYLLLDLKKADENNQKFSYNIQRFSLIETSF
jgi:hypothetical protein